MGTQVTSNGAQSDKVEHWSGEDVTFSYNARTEAFPSIEDACESLLSQVSPETDAKGNVKEGKDACSLFLASLLEQYNSGVRYAARREAVDAFEKTLGIEEGQETLFKSLVTAIRAKLDAVAEKPENLKIAKRKALAKLQAIAAIADAD